MKRLGIKFGSVNDPVALAIPVVNYSRPGPQLIDVVDGDTGESIMNISSVVISYDASGAVEATVKFWPNRLIGVETGIQDNKV